jgi:hypothetical protein
MNARNVIGFHKELKLYKIWSSHAGKMSMSVFCIVTPCGPIGKTQSFGGTYCLHLQLWRWKYYETPNSWYLPIGPHGVTTQRPTSTTESGSQKHSERHCRHSCCHGCNSKWATGETSRLRATGGKKRDRSTAAHVEFWAPRQQMFSCSHVNSNKKTCSHATPCYQTVLEVQMKSCKLLATISEVLVRYNWDENAWHCWTYSMNTRDTITALAVHNFVYVITSPIRTQKLLELWWACISVMQRVMTSQINNCCFAARIEIITSVLIVKKCNRPACNRTPQNS